MPARVERAKVTEIVAPRGLLRFDSRVDAPLDLVAVERTKCVKVLEGVIDEFVRQVALQLLERVPVWIKPLHRLLRTDHLLELLPDVKA